MRPPTPPFSGLPCAVLAACVATGSDPSPASPTSDADTPLLFDTAGTPPTEPTWAALPAPDLAPRISGLSYIVGQEWLVWGGENEFASFGDGARLDLRTGTWTAIRAADAPGQRSGLLNQRGGALGGSDGHVLVWGGHEAEGYFLDPTAGGDGLRDGAIYHVATGTWTPMAPPPDEVAFAGRNYPHAVWAESMLLVLGGGSDVQGDDRRIEILPESHPILGARFSPGADWFSPDDDVWRPITPDGGPRHRKHAAVAWTGTHLLVWGGQYELVIFDDNGLPGQRFYTNYSDGFRYDPVANTWSPMASGHGLSPRSYAASCWTGREFLVWGGLGQDFMPQDDGAAYDPVTDTWRPISRQDAPSARGRMGRTEWTGSVMVVWGGASADAEAVADGIVTLDEYNVAQGGAYYDPEADAWTPLPLHDGFPPDGIARHHTVWTGRELLVWAGWSKRRSPYGMAAVLTGLPHPDR